MTEKTTFILVPKGKCYSSFSSLISKLLSQSIKTSLVLLFSSFVKVVSEVNGKYHWPRWSQKFGFCNALLALHRHGTKVFRFATTFDGRKSPSFICALCLFAMQNPGNFYAQLFKTRWHLQCKTPFYFEGYCHQTFAFFLTKKGVQNKLRKCLWIGLEVN